MLTCVDQEKSYETNGYLSSIQVCDADEATHYRKCFDRLEAVEGKEKCAIGLLDRHFDQRFIWDLASHPGVLESVRAVLGPDVLLLATHFFCKYGPQEKFVAWHQDVTYWGLDPAQAVTAWYAVDDADRENGCMRVIPGSHRGGIREHGKSGRDGNLLSVDQEVPVSKAEEETARDILLRAGEISLHDGMLIHGSLPNRSTRRRCGLTLRYTTPSVRQVDKNSLGQSWRTILVSGEDRYGHFERCPVPFE